MNEKLNVEKVDDFRKCICGHDKKDHGFFNMICLGNDFTDDICECKQFEDIS